MSDETQTGEQGEAVAMPLARGACMAGGQLAAAMAQVIGAMNHVPKNGRNAFHKYDYATESDITNAVRAELSKVGVAVFPSVGKVTVAGDDRQGPVTTVELHVTFVHKSGEAMTTTWYGQGQDKTDKGYYKAYTGAIKYCLLKTFLMSTGDDPEATDGNGNATAPTQRSAPRKAQPMQEQKRTARPENNAPRSYGKDKDWQRANKSLRAALDGAGVGKADAAKYLEWVKQRCNASSLTNIPPQRLAKVMAHLADQGDNAAIMEHVRGKIAPAKVVDAPEVAT